MQTLFLPGAGGSAEFWRPLSNRLEGEKVLFSWPGLGDEPHDDEIQGIDDLVRLVERQIDGPVHIVAQSMGCIVALLLAIRHPQLVQKLALFVTSGGVKLDGFDVSNWRQDYRASFPHAADWIENVRMDLTSHIKTLHIPTLLVFGDNDPISPVSIGRHLETIFPDAKLHIIRGGDHDIGVTHVDEVSQLVKKHFAI